MIDRAHVGYEPDHVKHFFIHSKLCKITSFDYSLVHIFIFDFSRSSFNSLLLDESKYNYLVIEHFFQNVPLFQFTTKIEFVFRKNIYY